MPPEDCDHEFKKSFSPFMWFFSGNIHLLKYRWKKQKNSTRGSCEANTFLWEKANMYSPGLYLCHIKTAQNANQEVYSKYKCCVHEFALIIFYFDLVLKIILITHSAHQSSTISIWPYTVLPFLLVDFLKNTFMRCIKIYFNYHCSRNSFNILRKLYKKPNTLFS